MKFIKITLLLAIICAAGPTAHAQDGVYNLDETYDIEEGGTLHLSSDDADVTILGSDRPDVKLKVYRKLDVDGLKMGSSGRFKMEVEEKNGDLYIREKDTEEHRLVVGTIKEEYRIRIQAPHRVALDLRGDDETYRISDLEGGVSMQADDSEIELSGMKGEYFDFDIDDGSIRLEEGSGKLRLDMDDGELYVRNADFREIDADIDDGEMDITTSLQDDGLYLFDLDDGDLELNITGGGGEFDINHDNYHLGVGDKFEEERSDEKRTVYRLPGGEARVEIDTDDGEVELRTI